MKKKHIVQGTIFGFFVLFTSAQFVISAQMDSEGVDSGTVDPAAPTEPIDEGTPEGFIPPDLDEVNLAPRFPGGGVPVNDLTPEEREKIINATEIEAPPPPGTESTIGTILHPDELDDILDQVNLAPELGHSDVSETVIFNVGAQSTIQITRLGGKTIMVDISILTSTQPDKGVGRGTTGILESGGVFAEYSSQLIVEGATLSMETSAGKKQINILPQEAIEASETPDRGSITKLELKEESQRPVYAVKGERSAKLFGLFSVQLKIETKVNAETGEIISIKRPWWKLFTW